MWLQPQELFAFLVIWQFWGAKKGISIINTNLHRNYLSCNTSKSSRKELNLWILEFSIFRTSERSRNWSGRGRVRVCLFSCNINRLTQVLPFSAWFPPSRKHTTKGGCFFWKEMLWKNFYNAKNCSHKSSLQKSVFLRPYNLMQMCPEDETTIATKQNKASFISIRHVREETEAPVRWI